MVSGDIGDPYTYWAADLSNKHFAYSIDVHQVLSHLTFFISDNKLTRFSQSADRLQLQTQHKDKYNTNTKKNCKHRENPKHKKRQTQKRIQIQKIPTKDKYKIKHKHEKNLNAKMKRNTTRLAASAMLLCTG